MLEGWSSTAIAGVADAFIVDENNCIGPGRVVLIGLGNEDTCKALQNLNIYTYVMHQPNSKHRMPG